jgi:hypothetical protein
MFCVVFVVGLGDRRAAIEFFIHSAAPSIGWKLTCDSADQKNLQQQTAYKKSKAENEEMSLALMEIEPCHCRRG